MHTEEEALGTRLVMDTLSCLIEKEADPSKLIAMSPGGWRVLGWLTCVCARMQACHPVCYARVCAGFACMWGMARVHASGCTEAGCSMWGLYAKWF